MKKTEDVRTYGIRPLIYKYPVLTAFIFLIFYYGKGSEHNIRFSFIASQIAFLIFLFFFVQIIIVDSKRIRIIHLNLFMKNINLPLSNINEIVFWQSIIGPKGDLIKISSKNFNRDITTLIGRKEVLRIHNKLASFGVKVKIDGFDNGDWPW